MDTARTLIIEHGNISRTVTLRRPHDLHELSDLLVRSVGKRPAMLTMSGNVARATY